MEVEEGEMGEDDAPAPWYGHAVGYSLTMFSLKSVPLLLFTVWPMINTESTFIFSSIPIDYNLYRKFWTLQDYFRNPVQCYEKFSWMTFLKVNHLSTKAE